MEASCILQCGDLCSASDLIDKVTLMKQKSKVEEQSKKWTGLDTFELAFSTFYWKLGPTGLFMHDSCYINLCGPRNLAQAEKRKEKNCCRT